MIGEPGAVLMRTALAREIGRFRDSEFYVIDLDFWCRALERGDLFVLGDTVASFRVAAGSASVRTARSQGRDFRRFIGKLARGGRFGIRPRDLRIGKVHSFLNNVLRRAVYSAPRQSRSEGLQASFLGRESPGQMYVGVWPGKTIFPLPICEDF